MPFDATHPRVDFVVSTSLKWLCGTPGAGILYADKDLIPSLTPEGRGGPHPMSRNTTDGGYFLYHSIGIYPGKEQDLARAMAEFSDVWSAPNDRQWGYVLRKRQDFIDRWRRLINVPKGSLTTVDNVTEGLQKILRALPEGSLNRKRVLVAADCFPSLHFLLAGLAPKLGFTLTTVPVAEGRAERELC